MATRKAIEDVLARTEAERVIGEILIDAGLTPVEADPEPAELGRRVLGVLAKAVEFEVGTGKDPERNAVPSRRLVITGPWLVNPNGITEE